MRSLRWLARVTWALAAVQGTAAAEHRPAATAGAIAVANLDHQLAQASEPAAQIEYLLTQARFLADSDALETAVTLAESLPDDSGSLLLKARVHAAAHRFDEALDVLRRASRSGASEQQVAGQRTSILVATGHAAEALPQLESDAAARPGFASRSALATAYAELGRYQEADREYRSALDDLQTSSPFPYAWIHFARGLMWSEGAGDRLRGEQEYARSLDYLPQFAVANIHKAELEFDRGEAEPALARIEALAQHSHEPEALALLGKIHRLRRDEQGASQAFERARQRYTTLLARQPLAFADHAAEFYLGVGASPEQAWTWAERNLANRTTPRAFAIAIKAAAASGRDVCGLVRRMRSGFDDIGLSEESRQDWERRAAGNVMDQCR